MHTEKLMSLPARLADGAAGSVSDAAVDAAWRTLNYLTVAQLYLRSNVLLEEPLRRADVKSRPNGHWGVCPSANMVLAAVAPLRKVAAPGENVEVVFGAGHAGPSALAFSYLTGALGRRWPRFARSRAGIEAFVSGFPHSDGIGSEVSPLLAGEPYQGGQIGGALAFGAGAVLDRPLRLTVVLVGDGECETGITAATWMGNRVLRGTAGRHGYLLPVVLLNGLRMGGLSLLGSMTPAEQGAYFAGLGYRPVFASGSSIGEFREALGESLRSLRPLGGDERQPVLLLTLRKGATGPAEVNGRTLMGTPAVHKAPLRNPRQNDAEFQALTEWLARYRVDELLTGEGSPSPLVVEALGEVVPALRGTGSSGDPAATTARAVAAGRAAAGATFGEAVMGVFARWSRSGLRVFSPDEFLSNRLVSSPDVAVPEWVTEVLNEELCHLWLQGYIHSGGRGAFVSYEAFAALNISLVQQLLKQQSLQLIYGQAGYPSLNYVLTSLGWNNSYSHQNPAFVTALLETEDPTVRIFTPGDPARVAATLELMLADHGGCNVVMASKVDLGHHPLRTLEEELIQGVAIRPDQTDDGPPDMVIAAAGDLPARECITALAEIRRNSPEARIRYVQVNELTVLAAPGRSRTALTEAAFQDVFGSACPVILVVPCSSAPIRSMLYLRPGAARRVDVLGYRDPGRPLSSRALLRECGIDSASLARRASRVLMGGVSRTDLDGRPGAAGHG